MSCFTRLIAWPATSTTTHSFAHIYDDTTSSSSSWSSPPKNRRTHSCWRTSWRRCPNSTAPTCQKRRRNVFTWFWSRKLNLTNRQLSLASRSLSSQGRSVFVDRNRGRKASAIIAHVRQCTSSGFTGIPADAHDYSNGWIRTIIWVRKSGYQIVGGVVELSIHWKRLRALGDGFSYTVHLSVFGLKRTNPRPCAIPPQISPFLSAVAV